MDKLFLLEVLLLYAIECYITCLFDSICAGSVSNNSSMSSIFLKNINKQIPKCNIDDKLT